MKRETLTYLVYISLVLSFTLFLSTQILKNRGIVLTGRIIQTRGHPNSLNNERIETYQENLLLRGLQSFIEIEKLKITQTTNSLGFNDVEWEKEKPANTYRIIALGDSMTQGVWLPLNSSWPKQLEKKLNHLNLSIHFEVFNMGKGGWGTYEEVEAFKKIGLNYSPDMVILQYYNHDWMSPEVKDRAKQLWEKYQRGEYRFPPLIEKKLKRSKVSKTVISALLYGVAMHEYENEVNWEEEWERWTEKPLIELIDLVKERDIKLIVIAWDVESQEKTKLISLLSEYEIPFYDFSEYLPIDLPRCTSPLRLPDCHLSSLGYEIVANKTLIAIRNYLTVYEEK